MINRIYVWQLLIIISLIYVPGVLLAISISAEVVLVPRILMRIHLLHLPSLRDLAR